jgi:predicted DNA-binding transcriptional regulator AlpA
MQTSESEEVPPSDVLGESQPSILDANATADAATGGKNTDDTQLLNVQEVARLLLVPVSWVYGHTRPRSASLLPHVKLGKYLRFLPADIRNYLEDARSLQGVLH